MQKLQSALGFPTKSQVGPTRGNHKARRKTGLFGKSASMLMAAGILMATQSAFAVYTVQRSGSNLTITAGAGETNVLSMTLNAANIEFADAGITFDDVDNGGTGIVGDGTNMISLNEGLITSIDIVLGDGNDSFIANSWAQADGGTIDFGSGTADSLTFFGRGNNDNISIVPVGTDVTFARNNVPQIQLYCSGLETADVDMQSGDDTITIEDLSTAVDFASLTVLGDDSSDTFNVKPSQSTAILLSGGNQILADTFNLDTLGLAIQDPITTPDGVIGFLGLGDYQDITYFGMEIVNVENQPCLYTVAPLNATLVANDGGAAGVDASFDVLTNEPNCTWLAQSNDTWITITSPTPAQGVGDTTVSYTVTDNDGNPPRTGTISVITENGMILHTVFQNGDCTFGIADDGADSDGDGDASLLTVPAAGTAGATVEVTAGAGCSWTISENSSWLELLSPPLPNGTGNATFTVAVDSNVGPARSTTINLKDNTSGQIVSQLRVSQVAGCDIQIDSFTSDFTSAGGADSILVTGGVGCTWTAATGDAWITINNASGNGLGQISYTVAPNTGPARTGTITVGALTHTVNQGSGCVLTTPDPVSYNVSAAGQIGISNTINADAGCTWTAVSSAPSWVTITAGATGVAPGVVTFDVAQNFGPARSGTITVTGDNNSIVIAVNQAEGCDLTTNVPDVFNLNPEASSGRFTVFFAGPVPPTVSDACELIAFTDDNWIVVTEGANGSGSGHQVSFDVLENNGAARAGIIVVQSVIDPGDFTFVTINQAACALTAPVLAAPNATYNHEGGLGNFAVTMAAGGQNSCDWTVTSNVAWLNILSGPSGNGNGIVNYEVLPYQSNAGLRTGTFTVTLTNGGTAQFRVDQIDDCDLIAPAGEVANFDQDGGTGNFDVTLAAGGTIDCDWTVSIASTDPAGDTSWITLASAVDGVGNGLISYEVAPLYYDTTAPRQRTGTITITLPNGDTAVHNINQVDNCAPVVTNPVENYNHSAAAGSFTITGMTESCPWTLSLSAGGAGWVSIQSAQDGVGNGLVTYEVAENEGNGARNAVITVTGSNGLTATHTINQTDDCDLIAPAGENSVFTHEGGSGNFAVTLAAGGTIDCDWVVSVTSTDPAGDESWITLESAPNGVGNGLVAFSVAPLLDDPSRNRAGFITITLPNGDTAVHNIIQTDDCNPVLPADIVLDHSVQSDDFTVSGMSFDCPWTASVTAGAEWLSIQSGNDGVGNGLITYELVQPNFGNGNRVATITVTSTNGLADSINITQTDDCDLLALVPASRNFDQAGGAGDFAVPFAAGDEQDCIWDIAVSAPSWIVVTSSFNGVGDGLVTYEVLPFFDDQTAPRTRTGTITVYLPNGDAEMHTVNQEDFCTHTLDPVAHTPDQVGGFFEFDVNFSVTPNSPGTSQDCPWIARVRYAVPTTPDEEWVQLIEGSTEQTGDGVVTYNVDELHEYLGSRIAYIDVILDNGIIQTHTITQTDECEFTLYPTEFFFDHNGFLTGPVINPDDPNDDNSGTNTFQVAFPDPNAECKWTASIVLADTLDDDVVADDNWINILEGSTGEGNGQVTFSIDPNVVIGPDIERVGTILVTGENGQVLGVTIIQSEGQYILTQLELGDPGSGPDPEPDFGFGQDNLVIGYTDLAAPVIETLGLPDAPFFTTVDSKTGNITEVEPHISTDSNGNVTGFATVRVFDAVYNLLAEFDLPVTGSFSYSRKATTEVNTVDNNFSGFTTIKYKNSFKLSGKDKTRGSIKVSGTESYEVLPADFPGTPAGFESKISSACVLDGAASKGSAEATVHGWVPTTGNLAITKNSLKADVKKNTAWSSDIVLLDSDYTKLEEQGAGAASLNAKWQTGAKPGKFSYQGRFGKSLFKSSGQLLLTLEDITEEGFWFDSAKDGVGLDRGVTVFPETTSFSNPQVKISTKTKWNSDLINANDAP